MALLFRISWSIARIIFNLLVRLIQWLLPPLLSIAFLLLGWLLRLVTTSLTATVNGRRQFTDRLAAEWTLRLLNLGFSRDYLDQLYSLCRFFVTSTIVLGWVVATLFIMAVFRIVFGLFT
jgi:hypothetical protein